MIKDHSDIPENFNEEYFARMQRKYKNMSTSERKIADFLFLNGHENNLKYNINDLSKELRVSAATIVRFCRTIGFSGFSEFRYYMQRAILSPIGSSTQIGVGDNAHTITQKVARLLSKTTFVAAEVIDKKNLSKAINLVSKSKTVFFCGVGTGGGLAQMATGIFQHAGMKSCYIPDEMMQMRFVHTLERNDVVIGITNCGYIKAVVDTMKIAKNRGIPTICITAMANSLAAKYADITLVSSTGDYQNTVDQAPIIMAQMTIINALQIGCAVKKADELRSTMLQVLKLSELKRYNLHLKNIKIDRVKF